MYSTRRFITIIVSVILVTSTLNAQNAPRYKDPASPVETRVQDLLSKMTLEEKVDMLGGVEDFYIRPNERLGIPKIKMADGPLGVRNYGKATAFPGGIAFAASWNKDLTERFGEAVGKEARSKGVHIMLAPGVNIHRAPMCGRNFEYYGEDPYLASRMTVAYIKGVQSQGVVATVKHYAANNMEYDRHLASSDVDEHTLREIYLPTFRAAVEEAHVGAVMNAYNLLNGVHCSQNEHLLKEILKVDWKFDGLVMSDWGSTYDGVAAANAGLDLEMPSGAHMNRDTLLPAIKAGKVSLSTIDDKVRRMLRVMFRFGFFDRPQLDASLPLYNPESNLIALQAAREGIVLLKNRDNILPLDRSTIRSVAVIGPNAYPAVTGAGGSSRVQPFRSVSALDGIIALAGDRVRVFYAPGVMSDLEPISRASEFLTLSDKNELVRGMKGEYFMNRDLSGTPTLTRIDRQISFDWGESAPTSGMPTDDFSIRWTGKIRVDSDSEYEFFVRGDDGYRLFVNNQLIIDEWHDQGSTLKQAHVSLKAGALADVKLEYYERVGSADIALGYKESADPKERESVRLAAQSDVAIVCVGFNAITEGEGFDRSFALPKEQEDLIKEVAGVNKKTIVVLTAGGNVDMSGWLSDVAGLIHTWYPGQEGGTALGEILFGDINPSGRLPVTFEKRWEDNATFHSYYAKDKKLPYTEAVFVGYRHFDARNIEPQFPFGYGLSYTTFSCKNLKLTPRSAPKGNVTVTVDVTNTGTRTGAEVVQLYVRDVEAKVPRPVKELKAFDKVSLKPGETKTVAFQLGESAFAFYDAGRMKWITEPGAFEILVGGSSRDIKGKDQFTLLK